MTRELAFADEVRVKEQQVEMMTRELACAGETVKEKDSVAG